MDWFVSKSLTMGALFAKEVEGRSQAYQFMQHDAFVQALLWGPLYTLQKQNAENLKQIFPEKEYRGLSERIIYSHDGSVFSAVGNMWTDPGDI